MFFDFDSVWILTLSGTRLLLFISTVNTVFDLITAHACISAQSSNLEFFRFQPVYFYLLLYENICCGYSFELPRQVQAMTSTSRSNSYEYQQHMLFIMKIRK